MLQLALKKKPKRSKPKPSKRPLSWRFPRRSPPKRCLRLQARNEALAEYNALIEAAELLQTKIEAATAELEAETWHSQPSPLPPKKSPLTRTKAVGRDFAVG